MIVNKRKYVYTDESWYDGSEDRPCCSGMLFECYNLESYPDYIEPIAHYYAASCLSEHEILSDVLMMECGVEYVVGGNPYDAFTLQELKDVVNRLSVEVEIL
jgi:hypothetical protein